MTMHVQLYALSWTKLVALVHSRQPLDEARVSWEGEPRSFRGC